MELPHSTAKAVTPTSVRSLLTSVAHSLRWAPHYGAQYTVVYVFRAGTRSGKASAPTLVLLSVIQNFPDRSRVHGAEDGSPVLRGELNSNSQAVVYYKTIKQVVKLITSSNRTAKLFNILA